MAKKSKKESKNSPKASEEVKLEKTETEEIDEDGLVKKRTKCEVFSRVVGYIRPVHQWNPGKQSEFGDRKMVSSDEIKSQKKKGQIKKTK